MNFSQLLKLFEDEQLMDYSPSNVMSIKKYENEKFKNNYMLRACSWCGKKYGWKKFANAQDYSEKITHGICDDCVKNLNK